ncbi:MotA/TolQ/ExbB proton channel family protein [Shimia sp. R9_1]|uniref:MotA/TolQ/ExbB proton channel family protein n=1 Tax=Shimia sp. R9_1 TaxID=2821111 RepID=UPI001ADC5594|nr:MotA/TolQ/ExbB proton channel family protein [Shimia sp. R9_1]MBO9409619.1 MotA/TolQ/ExbB proton channel family protein [Shimia sp. R9_1]
MTRVLILLSALLLPFSALSQTSPLGSEVASETASAPVLSAPQVETNAPSLNSVLPTSEVTDDVPDVPQSNGANVRSGTRVNSDLDSVGASEAADRNTPVQRQIGADEEQNALANEAIMDDASFTAITDEDIVPMTRQQELTEVAQSAISSAYQFLRDGGPSIWAIASLSVATLALILWKIWQLALMGAWSRGKADQAIRAFENGNAQLSLDIVRPRRGVRSKVITATLNAMGRFDEDRAREDAARVAKNQLAEARAGLSALELIATIAPLLGLLGTVLGMIAAFQALQSAGSNADPSQLAGGIWEALLTTAAGMAVAIPASAALTWFESVIDRIHRDIEDAVTRLFVAFGTEPDLKVAAE